MRSKRSKYLLLLAGLFVAACVICSQTLVIKHDQDGKNVVETEKSHEQKNTESTIAFVSITSLPSPTVVHFTQQAVCLFEIIFIERPSAPTHDVVAPPLTKFFSTLLSVIISPNAP
jgi:hypothetical protein